MEIKLREVCKEDWDYILQLRNSFFKDDFLEQQKVLTKKEHYEYMEKQKSNTNFYQWISFDGKKNVGYIRLLEDDVSVIVDQKFQNKGIGTIMLALMEKEAKKIGLKKIKKEIIFISKLKEMEKQLVNLRRVKK